jgi:hypothetical protein
MDHPYRACAARDGNLDQFAESEIVATIPGQDVTKCHTSPLTWEVAACTVPPVSSDPQLSSVFLHREYVALIARAAFGFVFIWTFLPPWCLVVLAVLCAANYAAVLHVSTIAHLRSAWPRFTVVQDLAVTAWLYFLAAPTAGAEMVDGVLLALPFVGVIWRGTPLRTLEVAGLVAAVVFARAVLFPYPEVNPVSWFALGADIAVIVGSGWLVWRYRDLGLRFSLVRSVAHDLRSSLGSVRWAYQLDQDTCSPELQRLARVELEECLGSLSDRLDALLRPAPHRHVRNRERNLAALLDQHLGVDVGESEVVKVEDGSLERLLALVVATTGPNRTVAVSRPAFDKVRVEVRDPDRRPAWLVSAAADVATRMCVPPHRLWCHDDGFVFTWTLHEKVKDPVAFKVRRPSLTQAA